MKSRSGFTLVEIMIVVAIVGIMAAIGTAAISSGMNRSKVKAAESELEMIASAVLQLAWDTGRWPNGDLRIIRGGAVVDDISSVSAGLMYPNTNGVFGADWKGPYYEGSIADPWGDNYFFDPDLDGKAVVGSKNEKVTPVRVDDVGRSARR